MIFNKYITGNWTMRINHVAYMFGYVSEKRIINLSQRKYKVNKKQENASMFSFTSAIVGPCTETSLAFLICHI